MYEYYSYMNHYEKEAHKLYPEIYHGLYPYIRMVCAREDHIYNMKMQPLPDKETINSMADEVYQLYESNNNEASAESFGHGGFLKTLITVFLIDELLKRRHRPQPYPYPGQY